MLTAPAMDRRAPDTPIAPARPLAQGLRDYFAPRLGGLGDVHIATHDPSVAAMGAKAMTVGQRIGFAPGRYRPDTDTGRTLIAHELIHTRQQREGGQTSAHDAAEGEAAALAPVLAGGAMVQPGVASAIAPACDAEDYQVSMPEEDMQAQIAALAPSKLQSDIDAINEFLDRQTTSSPETMEMEQRRDQLQARLNALVRAAHTDPPKPKRGKAKKKSAAISSSAPVDAPPTDANAPRILRERTSMPTDDGVAVQAEVDRIILWLQRGDVSAGDKAILRQELATLAPQFEQARAQDSSARQGARLRATFADPGEGAEGLHANIAKIVNISTDPAEPGAAFIYDKGERVRISTQQAAELKASAAANMRSTLQRAASTAEYAEGSYAAQKNVNDEFPVVSAISGWLGGVDDPALAMSIASAVRIGASAQAQAAIDKGDLLAAVGPLVAAASQARRMEMAAYAYREGLISGAESAVSKLTFVRDCSAAIAIAIGAVVAAPFVAGAVAGAGITGLGASALTISGTGLVVGTGAGTVFGGAEVGGQLIAGADSNQALEAGRKVFKQRFSEGFAAGAGGATTRVVGQALGPASTALGRYGTNLVASGSGNFVGGTSASLIQGDDLGTAIGKGGRSTALGTISTTAGAPFGNSPLLQSAVSAGAGSFVSYADAKAQGATDEEAMRGVAIGLATTATLSGSRYIQGEQQRYEAKGQKFGRDVRAGALELKQQAADFVRPLTQPIMPGMQLAGAGGVGMGGGPNPLVMMMASTPQKGGKASIGGSGGGGSGGGKSGTKAPPAAKPPAPVAAPAAAPKKPTFIKAPPSVLDDKSAAVLRQNYPVRYRLGGFFRRIAGTGNITKITAVNKQEGGFETTIETKLDPSALSRSKAKVAAGAAKAPSFNTQARSRIGGLWKMGLKGWQRLHLVGPGFGDEAVAGMMLGPESINEIWQNGDTLHSNGKKFNAGIEGYLRELAADAARHNSTVRVRATAESWAPSQIANVKVPSGEPVFKRASYTFTYDGPDGKPISTTVHVEAPHPSTWGDGTAVKPIISVSGYGTSRTGD